MKFKKEKPPNYTEIVERFPCVANETYIAFTYGDTLYTPNHAESEVPLHLIAHEEVHVKQQGNEPAKWWKAYFEDDGFRLKQEVEAHHAQYLYVIKYHGKTVGINVLTHLIKALCSTTYDLGITYQQGERFIKTGVIS